MALREALSWQSAGNQLAISWQSAGNQRQSVQLRGTQGGHSEALSGTQWYRAMVSC